MITAKEAMKITEDSHPYVEEIHPAKRAYLETMIRRAAKGANTCVSFSNESMSDEWLHIAAWLSSYGYTCWFDANNNLYVRWSK